MLRREFGGWRAKKVADEQARVEPLLGECTALGVAARGGDHVCGERVNAGGGAGALEERDVVEQGPIGEPPEGVVEFAADQNALFAEAGEHRVETREPAARAKEERRRVVAQAERRDLGVGFDGETREEGAGFGGELGVGVEEEQPVGIRDGSAGAALAATTAARDDDVRTVLRGDFAGAIGALGVDDDEPRARETLLRSVQGGAEMFGFVERGNDNGERVGGGVAGDSRQVGAVGFGISDAVLGGEKLAGESEELSSREGRGENLVGMPRNVVEEFGRRSAKREEVVAAVGAGAEHELSAGEAGCSFLKRGAVEFGALAGNGDDGSGSAREGGAERFTQAATQIAVGLRVVVTGGAEPCADFGFGLGRGEMNFHLPGRGNLAQLALDHRAIDIDGALIAQFGGKRSLRQAGAGSFDEEQHDGLR